MKMLLSDAKALGLDYVELKATKDAVKLYKSLGFVVWGTQPRAFRHTDGTYHDAVHMTLVLQAPAGAGPCAADGMTP